LYQVSPLLIISNCIPHPLEGTGDNDEYVMSGDGDGDEDGDGYLTNDRYVWRYILLLKSFTVYGLDIFVAVTMISSEHVCPLSLLYIFIFKPFSLISIIPRPGSSTRIVADKQWTTTIARKCGDDCAVPVRFDIAKWIFVGCIIFSFLLVSPFVTHLRFLYNAHCPNPCLKVYEKKKTG
jgi:hypothetical protein